MKRFARIAPTARRIGHRVADLEFDQTGKFIRELRVQKLLPRPQTSTASSR